MSTKVTKSRTRLSGIVSSKAFERALIVAAVAAVLVAFGAWYAMARPTGTDAAASPSSAGPSGGSSASPGAPTSEAPAATTAPEAPAPETESPAEDDVPAASAPAPRTEAAPQAFLDQVTDSGLAPPVDDAQMLAMARQVCEEMSHGSTREDMIRSLTFAGATDEEAANFVQLAVTNICPEYA